MSLSILSSTSFGQFNRFQIKHCLTRFGTETFMVFDAEQIDPATGLAACIRQADTKEEAIATLELDGFAVGDLIQNFGQTARIFQVDAERGLFVKDVTDAQKWLAEPKFCTHSY